MKQSSERKYTGKITTLLPGEQITLGDGEDFDIKISGASIAIFTSVFSKEEELLGYKIHFVANGDEIKLNGKALVCKELERLETKFVFGDILEINGLTIEYRRHGFILSSEKVFGLNIEKLLPVDLKEEFPVDFPEYRRSPRIIYHLPDDQVKITTPEAKPTVPKNEWVKTVLPPILMIAMSFAMSMLSGG
ncbi:MAG: hypothetical protein LBM02_07580, partial [Lachnospiraceae bacterium]|nr:hypothetical protein [Lachnospiraceae bacterium]